MSSNYRIFAALGSIFGAPCHVMVAAHLSDAVVSFLGAGIAALPTAGFGTVIGVAGGVTSFGAAVSTALDC